MRRTLILLALALLPACAQLGLSRPGGEERMRLWNEAHQAFYADDFDRAASLFGELQELYPETQEGRESLFYLGTLRLDPRNPAWDPAPAEQSLRSYIAADTTVHVHRRPEAETLLRLAEQLNMPAEQRVPGLQPETRVVRVPQRVVVPARETRALSAEVERLRAQVAERDAKIIQQQEELERIRRTLTGRRQ